MTAPIDTLDEGTAPVAGSPRRRSGGRPKTLRRLTRRDKVVLGWMIAIPTTLHVAFVWVPTLLSVVLSFTRWDGFGGITSRDWVGFQNYRNIATIYPPFWPAVRHNLIWLIVLLVIPTAFGLLLAVLLDKELRFSRIYQSTFFLPVVLSSALIGFICQLVYSPDAGLINSTFHTHVDWLGNPKWNLWAVLVFVSWRHAGYIMVLYLAGLKSVDPSLREAAAIDGASEWKAFLHVVLPALRPINIVVLVVTAIEALRAFDIVYVINKGNNGLELLSVLVTNNIIGEASRIGYGSALGVILLLVALVPIITSLYNNFRREPLQ
jgi:multiple sugar transport system permease protein